MPNRSPDDASVGDRAEPGQPAPPVMPSFASLREPRRRTAVDVLVPGTAPAGPRPAPAAAPRPAEYPDLLLLGAHVARAVAGLPTRLLRWSLREPGRCVRRLLRG